ncbi:MAG: PP2C family protein-serine/threonine phosphatase, partial [Balneolaceae bacterium]|nr:PP2C family protein-serine/threonine phosphatase [Balneolaceae bacterium]
YKSTIKTRNNGGSAKPSKKVQEDLLPEIEIDNEQIHVLGKTLVPNELGGDFFDVLKISDSKYLLAVGDVSGHNFGAGLLMAMLKSALISHALHEHDIAALTKNLNQIIFEYSDARMFATFTLVEVDLKSHLFKVVSAGHPSVLIARNNQLIKSNPSGVGLGISKNAEFEIEEVSFKANDLLILYSDGLVERMTKENKRSDFGDFEKLILDLIAEESDTTKQLHFLQNSLLKYPEQLEDDATLLLLQRKKI